MLDKGHIAKKINWLGFSGYYHYYYFTSYFFAWKSETINKNLLNLVLFSIITRDIILFESVPLQIIKHLDVYYEVHEVTLISPSLNIGVDFHIYWLRWLNVIHWHTFFSWSLTENIFDLQNTVVFILAFRFLFAYSIVTKVVS